MSNNGPRFQARPGAGSGDNCCFDAHVVDTAVGPNHRSICEAATLADAIKIAAALNRDTMS